MFQKKEDNRLPHCKPWITAAKRKRIMFENFPKLNSKTFITLCSCFGGSHPNARSSKPADILSGELCENYKDFIREIASKQQAQGYLIGKGNDTFLIVRSKYIISYRHSLRNVKTTRILLKNCKQTTCTGYLIGKKNRDFFLTQQMHNAM